MLPALLAGAGISAVGNYFSARRQAKAARAAAIEQEKFAREGIDALRQRTNNAGEVLAPYQQAGQRSLDSLQNESQSEWSDSPLNRQFNLNDLQGDPLMQGLDPAARSRQLEAEAYGPDAALNRRFTNADFEKDPGYEFRMREGQRGLESSASARGSVLSGGTLKALEKYRQGFASNEFGAANQRFTNQQDRRFDQLYAGQQTALNEGNRAAGRFYGSQDRRFDQLYGVAGMGAQASSQRAGMLYGEGGQELDAMTGIGDSAGAAQAARGSAYARGIEGTTNSIGQSITMAQILKNEEENRKAYRGR
jgi:hypothetical protein